MRKERDPQWGTIRKMWDEAESFDVKDLAGAASIIADAERTGRARRRAILVWTMSAAAVIVALFVIGTHRPAEAPLPKTILASSADGKGSFQLPDGSTVWLNRGSSLSFDGDLKGETRTVTLTGEAYFDVAKDPDHPFIVRARDLDIQVLGTKFVVTSYENRPVSACLAEGSISACLAGADQVVLIPGQMLFLSEDGGLDRIENVNAADHTAWIGDRMDFQDASLVDIARSLEHWYGTRISFSDEGAAAKVRISMSVKSRDEEAEILSQMASLARARLMHPADDSAHLVLPSAPAVTTTSVPKEVTLRGTVRDTDRKPMPGVSVRLFSRGTPYDVVTGADGTFELTLPSIPKADDRISFHFPGHVEEVRKVGTASVFDIILTR